MSFKIPNIPTVNASGTDLADFLELMCLVNDGEYSIVNGTKRIAIGSDEINNEGVESEDDRIYNKLQDALREIEQRQHWTNGRYPFIATNNAIVLGGYDCSSMFYWCYLFLLFATRNNMRDARNKQGLDGAALFEELSALVAKEYWGGRAEVMLLGTGAPGGFRGKIKELVTSLHEGGDYNAPEGTTNDEKDGGMDLVVWKPFADQRKSKLIGFGQCKTGTEWQTSVSILPATTFCKTYLKEQPFCDPITLFFTSAVCQANYGRLAYKVGLLFDRCRLMDYLPMDLKLLGNQIRHWTEQCILDYKARWS